ncbi:MAG: cobalamin-binding protein [Deltaproteobacteria bacterium]|nr:cobalamin-binding protein [Deltaproteobacteria bacterium]
MEFLDEVSRTVSFAQTPRRIVCLVPSITETLFALGVGERVVGVTEYCTHPPDAVARVTKVGGTKDPQIETIVRLAPDIVIVNDEENRQEDFTALTERGLAVYVTAPRTVAGGIAMIERLGPVLGCQTTSDAMVGRLRSLYEQVLRASAAGPRLRVFCPIWRKPWMTFNADTYADDMLWSCGAENVVRAKADRYFSTTLEEIAVYEPEAVVLPSEPYPFTNKHFVHLKELADTPAGRGGHFYCIDGMALCWYGPRIADGLTELSRLFAYVRSTIDA